MRKSQKAQSMIEYTLVIMVAMAAIIVMGPYVIRSINAHMKGWEETVDEAMNDPLKQTENFPGIPACGDGRCEFPLETPVSCCKDCGQGRGDGTCCPPGEGVNNSLDCAVCGDGICTEDNNSGSLIRESCCQDCGGDVCGDGNCCVDARGTPAGGDFGCDEDCGTSICNPPDGICNSPLENVINCPSDCCAPACGDGVCEPLCDEKSICKPDCCPDLCNNGTCDPECDEINACPQDCHCELVRGNGTCNAECSEITTYPQDCCSQLCGNGICNHECNEPNSCAPDQRACQCEGVNCSQLSFNNCCSQRECCIRVWSGSSPRCCGNRRNCDVQVDDPCGAANRVPSGILKQCKPC